MAARRVYLVRHAKAEPHAERDAARRLTHEGRQRFQSLVGGLAAAGQLPVSRILCSPLTRARQTADVLGRATGAPVEEDPRLTSGALDGRNLLALAAAAPAGTALVGHNPEVAEAVARAAGRGLEVKPGSVIALDVEGREAKLAWLEAPAQRYET